MRSRQNWRRWPAAFGLCAVGWVALAGCSPPEQLKYSPRTDIKGQAVEIPEKHSEQIAKYLDQYFGPPLNPRLMMPAPAAAEGEAAASAESSDGGNAEGETPAAKPDVKLVDAVDRQVLRHGARVYREQCQGCHGVTGDGKGPAAAHLNPPPRDYRLGRYKFSSTPRGTKPRREDLERVIRRGAKGTSMPAFRWMSDGDMGAVIEYVKLLSNRGELELLLIYDSQQELTDDEDYDPAAVGAHLQDILASWDAAKSQVVLPLTVRPAYDEASIKAGAQAFVKLECIKCHGKDGRGNKKFNVGADDWGRIAFAADLTSGMLHGGRRPVDIYRRIYSGINATPMPAFNNPNSATGETPEQRSETIWHMVHFVTSIVEGKPLPTDVIEQAIQETPAAHATESATGDAPAPSADNAAPPASDSKEG